MKKKIIHNGFVYLYRGYTIPIDPREMHRHLYYCSRHSYYGGTCGAKLYEVVYHTEFTDEPPYVEVVGEHDHSLVRRFYFPYPFKSMAEYKRYKSLFI